MQQPTFSVSTNILRDSKRDIQYVPTPNSQLILHQIADNFQKGIHAFSIIGSYGTGKSSFLWALEHQLSNGKKIFRKTPSFFEDYKKFRFLNLIGEYASLSEILRTKLGLKAKTSTENIVGGLKQHFKKGCNLILIIDEFGKFLEYAAKNNPEEELFFIQQIVELINDPEQPILLLTTLHQNFSAYGRSLPKEQRQEWDKVRGRFKELTFNEPVEQLLYLASQRLSLHSLPKIGYPTLYPILNNAHLTTSEQINKDIFYSLSPFDYLTAFFLTRALQRYAQNERSLFTFIKTDHHLKSVIDMKGHFGVSDLYSCLIDQYSEILFSRDNPDLSQWTALRIGLEKTEAFITGYSSEALQIVQLIGLVTIFGRGAGGADKNFITKYFEILNPQGSYAKAIVQLEKHKIIRFASHRKKYLLFDGTDLNIEAELVDAASHFDVPADYIHALEEYLSFQPVLAKEHFLKTGTPRFFHYKITSTPIEENPNKENDGCINIIVNRTRDIKKGMVKGASSTGTSSNTDVIVHVLYNDVEIIERIISEIKKLEYVLLKKCEDAVARRELQEMLEHEKKNLRTTFHNHIFSPAHTLHWYSKGERLDWKEISEASLNRHLSKLCDDVYYDAPIIKNELFNRSVLSTAIRTAKRPFIEALLKRSYEENIGFSADKFPPEKAIYLTMLSASGIDRKKDDQFSLETPKDSKFKKLWYASEVFLEKAKRSKLPLSELIDIWKSPPFGLKDGVIQFLLPTFLIAKQEEFSLFGENGYLPYLTTDLFDLLLRKPTLYKIKTSDLTGIRLKLFDKYKQFVQLDSELIKDSSSLNSAIRPFLVLIHQLPDYTKHTRKGLSKTACRLRDAIAQSQEPEKAFFEDIPLALGYSNGLPPNDDSKSVDAFIDQLKEAIREIRNCFGSLLDRIEVAVLDANNINAKEFSEYQQILSSRFISLKPELLPTEAMHLLKVTISPIDDRNAWLSAITHSLIHKRAEALTDEEADLVLHRIKDGFNNLDAFVDIHLMKTSRPNESIYKARLYSTTNKTPQDFVAVVNENNKQLYLKLKQEINTLFKGQDENTAKAVLIKTLEEVTIND